MQCNVQNIRKQTAKISRAITQAPPVATGVSSALLNDTSALGDKREGHLQPKAPSASLSHMECRWDPVRQSCIRDPAPVHGPSRGLWRNVSLQASRNHVLAGAAWPELGHSFLLKKEGALGQGAQAPRRACPWPGRTGYSSGCPRASSPPPASRPALHTTSHFAGPASQVPGERLQCPASSS